MENLMWRGRHAALGILALACGDVAGIGPAAGITVSVIAREANQVGGSAASGAVRIDRLRLVLGGVKLETAGVETQRAGIPLHGTRRPRAWVSAAASSRLKPLATSRSWDSMMRRDS